MGGLFGIGGSAAKTDRNQQLTSWGDLKSLFNFGSSAGEKGVSTAMNFWDSIMSGNSGQIAKTLSPEISGIKNRAAQTKDTLSQFGNRSGGTNAAVQSSSDDVNSAINNLINTLLPQAAIQEGNLGMGLLNTAESSAATVGAQAGDARNLDVPIQQAQQSAVMQGILDLFGMGKSKGSSTGSGGGGGGGDITGGVV